MRVEFAICFSNSEFAHKKYQFLEVRKSSVAHSCKCMKTRDSFRNVKRKEAGVPIAKTFHVRPGAISFYDYFFPFHPLCLLSKGVGAHGSLNKFVSIEISQTLASRNDGAHYSSLNYSCNGYSDAISKILP